MHLTTKQVQTSLSCSTKQAQTLYCRLPYDAKTYLRVNGLVAHTKKTAGRPLKWNPYLVNLVKAALDTGLYINPRSALKAVVATMQASRAEII